jgi:hypothetical protein
MTNIIPSEADLQIVCYDTVCKTCGVIAQNQPTINIAKQSKQTHENESCETIIIPIPSMYNQPRTVSNRS